MKKQSPDRTVFKIKFSNIIFLLCALSLLLCGAGIALSIWRIYRFGILTFTDVLKYPFLIAVCLFCIVLVIAILIKSQYAVDKTCLITQYGFIKTKFEIKDITEMTLDTQTQKLTVKFGEPFMVFSLCEKWSDKLIKAILEINPDIDYSFTLTDAPAPTNKDEDKKDN